MRESESTRDVSEVTQDVSVQCVVINSRPASLKAQWGRSFIFDGRVAGHQGDTVGLKTLSIHVCVCPHFGM